MLSRVSLTLDLGTQFFQQARNVGPSALLSTSLPGVGENPMSLNGANSMISEAPEAVPDSEKRRTLL